MFRIPPRLPKTLLSLLAAGTIAGCFAGGDGTEPGSQERQLIRGSIALSHYSSEIVGVRVLSESREVTTATTDSNGNFNIAVPVGENYSFEIVTKSGTHAVLTGPIDGDSPLHFDVCNPGEDFDLGEIDPIDFEEIDGDETPWGETEDECDIPPWLCEDGSADCWDEPLPCGTPTSDPTFCWDEPLSCEDPASDPDFCLDEPGTCVSKDGTGCDEPPPPFCEDGSGDCIEIPEPCDDPASDPTTCWEPCDDPSGIGCEEPPLPCEIDPATGIGCEEPPLPCEIDPASGIGCEEPPLPCEIDPASGIGCEEPPLPCETDPVTGVCDPGEPTCDADDPSSCWPEPDPCTFTASGEFVDCETGVGGAPEIPFPDFGCGEVPDAP